MKKKFVTALALSGALFVSLLSGVPAAAVNAAEEPLLIATDGTTNETAVTGFTLKQADIDAVINAVEKSTTDHAAAGNLYARIATPYGQEGRTEEDVYLISFVSTVTKVTLGEDIKMPKGAQLYVASSDSDPFLFDLNDHEIVQAESSAAAPVYVTGLRGVTVQHGWLTSIAGEDVKLELNAVNADGMYFMHSEVTIDGGVHQDLEIEEGMSVHSLYANNCDVTIPSGIFETLWLDNSTIDAEYAAVDDLTLYRCYSSYLTDMNVRSASISNSVINIKGGEYGNLYVNTLDDSWYEDTMQANVAVSDVKITEGGLVIDVTGGDRPSSVIVYSADIKGDDYALAVGRTDSDVVLLGATMEATYEDSPVLRFYNTKDTKAAEKLLAKNRVYQANGAITPVYEEERESMCVYTPDQKLSVIRVQPDGNAMYRLFNKYNGEHFYTASTVERDYLSSIGWSYEGKEWLAPKTGGTEVYRLYNPYSSYHHYTTDQHERDELVKLGWQYEGIAWYSAGRYEAPVLRFYNPSTGLHHYTTSDAEGDYISRNGWTYEGVGWYGVDEI